MVLLETILSSIEVNSIIIGKVFKIDLVLLDNGKSVVTTSNIKYVLKVSLSNIIKAWVIEWFRLTEFDSKTSSKQFIFEKSRTFNNFNLCYFRCREKLNIVRQPDYLRIVRLTPSYLEKDRNV